MKRTKMLSELVIGRYPVRTCRTLHHCELCHEDITLGEQYHDGGYSRRFHVRCAAPEGFNTQGKEAPSSSSSQETT